MRDNCEKSFFSSLLAVAAVSAGAYICYRTVRNLITFCAVFDSPVATDAGMLCNEIDERAEE